MKSFEKASAQICHSLSSLEKKKEVNMIILGGSVTAGGYAHGCYEGECHVRSGERCVDPKGECLWHKNVAKYLEDNSQSSNLRRIDLGIGATSTCTVQYSISQALKRKNVILSNQDIIFLDYSANDGVIYSSLSDLSKLKFCLQSLINQIYILANKQWPTIILLEYWPFRGLVFSDYQPIEPSYTDIYHEVARAYHLPIISYRDVYWSEVFRKKLQKYPAFESVVRYHYAENDSNADLHPAWVVHDLYADLISAVLRQVISLCSRDPKGFTEEEVMVDIPETGCDNKKCINVLNLVAPLTAPLLSIEEISKLEYGWHLYQDRLGKPGWIIQSEDTNKYIQRNNKKDIILEFYTNISTLHLIEDNTIGILKISYMKTYLNAGTFKVSLCNKYLIASYPSRDVIIDTLHKQHYTTSEVVVYDFKLKEICNQDTPLSIKIEHILLNDNNIEIRKNYKVKITSIQLSIQYI